MHQPSPRYFIFARAVYFFTHYSCPSSTEFKTTLMSPNDSFHARNKPRSSEAMNSGICLALTLQPLNHRSSPEGAEIFSFRCLLSNLDKSSSAGIASLPLPRIPRSLNHASEIIYSHLKRLPCLSSHKTLCPNTGSFIFVVTLMTL